jgi:putative pyrroloquinoline-quinone binding quinoprotein/putative pyrroloquinoline-quinone-binding quinoprotein
VPTRAVWTLVLNSQLIVPPGYDATHAYFALEGDRVAAYSLPEGTRLWMVDARPLLRPAAGDDLVFLTEAAGLVARRASDGEVAWQRPMPEVPIVPPVFDTGRLIVATKSGHVELLHAKTGATIWERTLDSPAHASPSFAADRIYVPIADNRIAALQTDSGDTVWERRLGGAPNEILVDRDRLYVGALDNVFYCLLVKDGVIDWRWRTGGDVIGAPVADERHIFFVALDNLLRAMDRKTGAQVWMRPLPVRPVAGVVLAGSTLVVAGPPAALRVFMVKDGVPATGEPIPPGAPVQAAPVIISSYTPGAEIPRVALNPADLTKALPDTIPPEIDNDMANSGAAKAASLATDAESAAPPHVVTDPVTQLPLLLVLSKDVARGAGATLVRREFEPPVAPLSPLPNMVMIAPQNATPTPR